MMASGNDSVVIKNPEGSGTILSVKAPRLSVIRKVGPNRPDSVGVPAITPLPLSRMSPAGSEPPTSA